MNMIRKFFSLFNMMALILLVVAAYLWREVQRPPATPVLPPLQLAEKHVLKMNIFYADTKVQNPVPLARNVEVNEEDPLSIAQAALNMWAQGPGGSTTVLPVVPKGTLPPKVYLRGNAYYVDLPPEYKQLQYGTSGERMLICTITRTLIEKRGNSVTFLIGGKAEETLGHLDLREAFGRQDCQ